MPDGLCIRGQLSIVQIAGWTLWTPPCDEEVEDRIRRGHAFETQVVGNLVVDLGRSVVRALVGNGEGLPTVSNGTQSYPVVTIADLAITEMRFGNENAPTAPAASDFDLFDATPLVTVTPVAQYPTNFAMRWDGIIPANQYTGEQVTEEALFCANGALFARTTFSPEVIVTGFGKLFRHRFDISVV